MRQHLSFQGPLEKIKFKAEVGYVVYEITSPQTPIGMEPCRLLCHLVEQVQSLFYGEKNKTFQTEKFYISLVQNYWFSAGSRMWFSELLSKLFGE